LFVLLALVVACVSTSAGSSASAPGWMHEAATAPVPAHDEKDDIAVLYEEEIVNVFSAEKIVRHYRVAYKVLRPSEDAGIAAVSYGALEKVRFLRGWCIPASGKDYEVQEKDALEVSLPKVANSELVSDIRAKLLKIPAADPGNVIGFEYETEERPLALQDIWSVQDSNPAREKRYSLILPPGWEYKTWFLNYPEIKPTHTGNTEQLWVAQDVKCFHHEKEMPPYSGVVGHMVVSFLPPGGRTPNAFSDWSEMGNWYLGLTNGRTEASPAIKQKVAELTSSVPDLLGKMKAIANFVQRDNRYVAIELGIGGWQPHFASDIYNHHYGDCKDKSVLMISMLREIGVETYYVVINDERGSVTSSTPANAFAFNHAIIAIRLPNSVPSDSFGAAMTHPVLGRLLFFDPTNDITPLGEISGNLQANSALLVAPQGGGLVTLPQQPSASNGIERTAHFTLSSSGVLSGDVDEKRVGDRAAVQRYWLRSVMRDSDKIKPIENLLADSLSSFEITKAKVGNTEQFDRLFFYQYSFVSPGYARHLGDLLAVRLRVIGSKSSPLLETKEPRVFPIEFEGPVKDTDTFEITIPQGYVVDDLPAPMDLDYGFASYHAKSEVHDNVIRYTRTFEIKELSVPASRAAELKKFYRLINSDERGVAVLKVASK
jgi:hypothetical protein